MKRRTARFLALLACCVLLASCGGGSEDIALADTASCSIERSSLGPFGPDTTLGESMDETQARQTMARDNVAEFIAITATGPWSDAWDVATDRLGNRIHTGLSWIDVGGELRGLFEDGDAYEFAGLRVSRSFQGKIEHATDPIYLPVPDDGRAIDVGATCTITAIDVGDQSADRLSTLTDDLAVAAG